jgi:hypothetical protein
VVEDKGCSNPFNTRVFPVLTCSNNAYSEEKQIAEKRPPWTLLLCGAPVPELQQGSAPRKHFIGLPRSATTPTRVGGTSGPATGNKMSSIRDQGCVRMHFVRFVVHIHSAVQDQDGVRSGLGKGVRMGWRGL